MMMTLMFIIVCVGMATTLSILAFIVASRRSLSHAPLAFVPGYFWTWIGHFIFGRCDSHTVIVISAMHRNEQMLIIDNIK